MSKAKSPSLTCTKAAGRPKASEVEARTHELVQIAGALILEHGYSNVSLETIAREARVAVRTIYVKFGGKAGLIKAALLARREQIFPAGSMEADTRPLREILDDFAMVLHTLLRDPHALAMQRLVIAESNTNPELAQTFYDAGPRLTRAMLERFFARPEIRAQLREDLPFEHLPTYLIACINGDPLERFLPPESKPDEALAKQQLALRMQLFYRSVLKHP
jgi:TetR/AcrR family transcriptional repressor of mexJK operon